MHPDDRSGEMPTHRSFATIADLPFSEQKGPFRVGITLPITPEEWQRIRDILRARPEVAHIDCQICDAERDTDHAHAVLWRKHVSMLHRHLRPREVAELIGAVRAEAERDSVSPPQQREPTPACNSATGACLSPRACDYEGKCRRDAAKQEEPK